MQPRWRSPIFAATNPRYQTYNQPGGNISPVRFGVRRIPAAGYLMRAFHEHSHLDQFQTHTHQLLHLAFYSVSRHSLSLLNLLVYTLAQPLSFASCPAGPSCIQPYQLSALSTPFLYQITSRAMAICNTTTGACALDAPLVNHSRSDPPSPPANPPPSPTGW